MLIRKIHCQPTFSTSNPPSTGPASVATPATEPHTEIGTPRFSGGNSLVTNDSVCGVINAAPSPCRVRAAISSPADCASPLHADAMVNATNPATSTRLGPYRSPSRPVISSGTVFASR